MSPPVGIDAVGRKTKISAPPSRPTFDGVAGAIPVSSADGVTTGLGSLAEVEGATAVSTTAGIEGRELPSASISVVSIGGGGGSSDCAAGAELLEGRASTGALSPVKTPNPRKPANFRSRSNCGAPDIKATRARARPGSGQSSRSAEKVRRAASAWMKAPPRSMPSRAHSASANSPASGAFHSSRAASTGSAGPNRPSGLRFQRKRTGPSSGGGARDDAAVSSASESPSTSNPDRGASTGALGGAAATRKLEPFGPATRAHSNPSRIGDRPAKKRSCSIRGAPPIASDCAS